ncbi:hypothetical protein D9M71_295330 [compost metagenome]
MVEHVALGGDPGHFRAFLKQVAIILFSHHAVLATEGGVQGGQDDPGFRDAAMAGQAQAAEDRQMFGRQRIAAAFHHARDAGLECLTETPRMQFGDEELGDLLRQVLMTVGVAGHLQLGQRVGAHVGEAQWFEQAGEGQAAARQLAVLRPVDRSDRAMIEQHLAPGLALLDDIATAIGHGLDQLVEQAEVQRFGQPGAMYGLLGEGEVGKALRDFDVIAQPLGGLCADHSGNQLE